MSNRRFSELALATAISSTTKFFAQLGDGTFVRMPFPLLGGLARAEWDMTPVESVPALNGDLAPALIGTYATSTIVGKEASVSASTAGLYSTAANLGTTLPLTGKYWCIWKPHAVVGAPAVAANLFAVAGNKQDVMAPGGAQLQQTTGGLTLNSTLIDGGLADEESVLLNIDFDAGTVFIRTARIGYNAVIFGGFVEPCVMVALVAYLSGPGAVTVSSMVSTDPADLAGLTPEAGYLPLVCPTTLLPSGLTAPTLLDVTAAGKFNGTPYAVGDGALLVDDTLNVVIPLGATHGQVAALDTRLQVVEKASHKTNVIKLASPAGTVVVQPVSGDTLVDCDGADSTVTLELDYLAGASAGDRLTVRFTNIAAGSFVKLVFGIVGWHEGSSNIWQPPKHVIAGDALEFVYCEYELGAFAWYLAGTETAVKRVETLAVSVGSGGTYSSLIELVADLNNVKCDVLAIDLLDPILSLGGTVDFTAFKQVEISAAMSGYATASLQLIGHSIKLSGTWRLVEFGTTVTTATILHDSLTMVTTGGVSLGIVIDKPTISTGDTASLTSTFYAVKLTDPRIDGVLHIASADLAGGTVSYVGGAGRIASLYLDKGTISFTDGPHDVDTVVNSTTEVLPVTDLIVVNGSVSLTNVDCGAVGAATAIMLERGTIYGTGLSITGTRTADFSQAPYLPTDKGVIYAGPAPDFDTKRKVTPIVSVAGVLNIDLSLGLYFTTALFEDITGITFSGLPSAGHGETAVLMIAQGAAAYAMPWPASFKWAGGLAATVSAVPYAVDRLSITTLDVGTTWEATLSNALA